MITALAVLVALGSSAAEVTPTPAPAPTPSLSILSARPGLEPMQGSSLADVAKRIKLNLPANQPRVITNDSVKQLAQGVELTTSAAAPPVSMGGNRGATAEERKKAIWQERYRASLDRVRRLESDETELSARANRLEQEFYAHDDPAYRDSTIKPAWDRALADLAKTKRDLAEARGEPDRVLNAARRDGALPGWFRGLDEGAPATGGGEREAPRHESAGRPPATPTPPAPHGPIPPPN